MESYTYGLESFANETNQKINETNQKIYSKNISIVKLKGAEADVIIRGPSYYITSDKAKPPNLGGFSYSSYFLTVSKPDTNPFGTQVVFVSSSVYDNPTNVPEGSKISESMLTVNSTDKNGLKIKFEFLDKTSGSAFQVISSGVEKSGKVLAGTYTSSRTFVWKDDSTLSEVDASVGFTTLIK
jgi:hypothetical protein